MAEIVTDLTFLRQKSVPVELDNIDRTEIQQLFDSFPDYALGLAAPQIGILKRMFVVRLDHSKVLLFINPSIIEGEGNFPSVEGCLSLPDVTRCVNRNMKVTICADRIEDIRGNILENQKLILLGLDAAVVQHEFDHLEGVLITDLPTVMSQDERYQSRQKDRASRIKTKRKKISKTRVLPMNERNRARLEKSFQRTARFERKRVEAEERMRAERSGLLQAPENDKNLAP